VFKYWKKYLNIVFKYWTFKSIYILFTKYFLRKFAFKYFEHLNT